MKRVKKDIDDILSLESKKKILKEIHQEELLDLFKGYKCNYQPLVTKKSPLDHQIGISITQVEKDNLIKELNIIRKCGPNLTLSSFIRSRSIASVDIAAWADKAIRGLRELQSDKYDRKYLNKKKTELKRYINKLDDDDDETMMLYAKQIKEIEDQIQNLNSRGPRKQYKVTGRVTFNEANIIRHRAARLSLPVADYMRFLLFGYEPFSDADRTMSIDNRKRFYVSILDVYHNGWGEAPKIEGCPNCRRYMDEVKALRTQLSRFSSYMSNNN